MLLLLLLTRLLVLLARLLVLLTSLLLLCDRSGCDQGCHGPRRRSRRRATASGGIERVRVEAQVVCHPRDLALNHVYEFPALILAHLFARSVADSHGAC